MEIARVLLEHGANLEAVCQGTCMFTPLHEAAWNGKTDVVRWLIGHGAKVTATAGHGETALHLAAQEGHADIIRALIASGADVYARDGSGKTALDVATAKGKEACISPLRQAMENKE